MNKMAWYECGCGINLLGWDPPSHCPRHGGPLVQVKSEESLQKENAALRARLERVAAACEADAKEAALDVNQNPRLCASRPKGGQ